MENNKGFISFNVVCNNHIMNKNNIPILYYWNGKSVLTEELSVSDEFKQYLKSTQVFDDIKNLINTEICYCTYMNGEYKWERIPLLTNLYNIENTEEIFDLFVKYICDEIENHDNSILNLNYKVEDLNLIYKILNSTYGISLKTFLEYIRYMLTENLKSLRFSDIEKIIDKIRNILDTK